MRDLSDRSMDRMAQFLTTEHFTLQGARNGTIAEANGRVGHYLSTVGSGLVALAFVANAAQLQPIFLAFSSVIFPMMIVMGMVTLVRIVQIGIHDARLAQAMNRIHHFYVEVTPEAEAYFSFPHFDDQASVLNTMMPFHFPLQGLAATPGPLILINSVISGAFTAIVCGGVLGFPLIGTVGAGVTGLVLAFLLHRRFADRLWRQGTQQTAETRFPAPDA